MHATLPKLPVKMPSERSRSRRERRSDAARRPVLHVVAPGVEVARETPRKGETITAFLRRTGWATRHPKYGWQFKKHLRTIVIVNGEPVLRGQWRRTRIVANDNVCFVSYPRGGGGQQGKQVLGLVALVAVAAFAPWAGGAIAGALGFGGSAIATGLATAAVGLGGALLVNALVAPKSGATNDPNATTDQIYTAQAQGNLARLGQPLPVWYGRLKAYPDLAATPWGEFVGNDQYLNVLLAPTMGSMEYEQILISDTPAWNPTDGVLPGFSSMQIQFCEPGEPVTLFPTNVAQSEEVTGQQLPHGTGLLGDPDGEYGDGLPITPGAWLGPFIANPSGTKAYQIAVDYVFPSGSFVTYGQQGLTGDVGISMTAEAQAVDDAGAPTGDWFTLSTTTTDYATKSPVRGTILATLPTDGRYQVRFRRNEGVPKDNKGAAELVWAGLRAYLRGSNVFPDVSTIAIRIKATETTQGSFKFGVIGTRKLPVWNGSTFVTQATRSPQWTLFDMATNSLYGAEVPISKTDFNAIVNEAANAATRGDTFDYVFSSAVAVPDAFDKALTVARSRHMWLGDVLSLVRDEWRDVPSMLLTDREIVRGSTSVEWTMLGEEDPDAVIVEYVDQSTWTPQSVQYPPNTVLFTATRPETKRVDGIVNRDQAYREAAFYYLCSIYRREVVGIDCEYEGRAITFGQTLRVQSELPQNYGYGGAIIASAGAGGRTLTLDPAPSWADAGTHFIRIRRPNGNWFGPITVTRGTDDAHAVLDATDLATVQTQQGITLANALLRADGGEYPSFELGTADNQSKVVKVLSGQPNGDTFTLSLVVDDERVHATDLGSPPVLPVGQFPVNDKIPLVIGLNAIFDQGIAEPVLRASWFVSAAAIYYSADVSYDDGASWINVYEGIDNRFEKVVTLGALKLRVQAVGNMRGPYAEVDVDAPTITLTDNTVALQSLRDYIKQEITKLNQKAEDAANATLALIASISDNQDSADWLSRDETRQQLQAVSGTLQASITHVETVAASETAALAQTVDTVSASVGANTAAIETTQTAVATIEGQLAVSYSVKLDVNGYIVGYQQTNGGPGTGATIFTTDFFQIVGPGSSPKKPFTVGTVGGVTSIGINADNVLIDASVKVSKLDVAQLSAITADLGTITTGTIIISD